MKVPKKEAALVPELLKKRAVGQLLSLTDPGVMNLQRRDPSFPRPLQLGSEFALRWVRAEILAWVAAQERREPTGVDAVTRRKQMAAQREAAKGPDAAPAQA